MPRYSSRPRGQPPAFSKHPAYPWWLRHPFPASSSLLTLPFYVSPLRVRPLIPSPLLQPKLFIQPVAEPLSFVSPPLSPRTLCVPHQTS
jgi:hypothetical protein